MTTLAPQAIQQIAALQQAGIPIEFDAMGMPRLRAGFTPTAQQAQLLSGAGFSVPAATTAGAPTATAVAAPPSFAEWAAVTPHPTQSGQTWADYWQSEQGSEHPNQDQALALYNSATAQALSTQQAGSRSLSGVPSGLTSLGRQNDEGPSAMELFQDASGRNFVRSMYTPTQADISAGLAKQAPDGTWYTEYNRANQTGAEHDTGNGIFFGAGPSMVDLPVTLAAGVPLAGVTGVLGGLQGLEGTSLIPGFDAAQYMGGTPTPPSGVLSGGTDVSWGVNPIGGGTGGGTALSPEAGASYGLPETTLSDTILGNVGSGGTTVGGVGLGGGLSGGGLTVPGQVLDLANSGTGATIPGTGGGGAAGGVTPPPGSTTALQRIMSGEGTAADWASIGGNLLQGGLGIFAGNQQADAIREIANQSRADRLPALNAFNSALANPDTFYNSAPAMGGLDAVLRKLSIQGNPAMNPGALSQAAAYNLGAYGNYLRDLTPAAFGTASSENNINLAGVGAQGGAWEAGGSALENIFNPRPQYRLNLGVLGP